MSADVTVTGLGRVDRGREAPVTPNDVEAYAGIRETFAVARPNAAAAVNPPIVRAHWVAGRRNLEAQDERAESGKRPLHYLAGRGISEFAPGLDESNLRNRRCLYVAFPIQEALFPEELLLAGRCVIAADHGYLNPPGSVDPQTGERSP